VARDPGVAAAPISTGGPPGWDRYWRAPRGSKFTNSPWNSATSLFQIWRIASTRSTRDLPTVAVLDAVITQLLAFQPAAIPST